MKQGIIFHSRKTILSIVIFHIFLFSSCRVTYIPDYDSKIAEQIENTAKAVEKFYLVMLETASEENGGRVYNKFAEQYINIQVELNSLLNKNKNRPLNENSTRVCEITLELWMKYKEEHKKDNTLSNGVIKLNKLTFDDLFYAMQVAEQGKLIIANPPK